MLLSLTQMLPPGLRAAIHALRKRCRFAKTSLCASFCVTLLAAFAAGCGSATTAGAKAGPIAIASLSGTSGRISSLVIASTLELSMMPSADTLNAGVDWSVACGGSPVNGSITNGACGTFAPAHTADGAITQFIAPSVAPIGTTVTITATVTSAPSQTASVILAVLAQPVSITLTSAPPGSLVVNQRIRISAQVINDVAKSGILWSASCGAVACGSFYPAITTPGIGYTTTYTAPSLVPANGTVTITATSLTDTTKSSSQTVAITGQASGGALGISVSPTTFFVSTTNITSRTFRLTATVLNDTANEGVDWTVTCSVSSCGTVTAHTASGAQMTYLAPITAPPDGKVTLTASATANSTITAAAIGTILASPPVTVTIPATFAPPATMTAGATTTLEATVSPTPDPYGVDWTATCGTAGACGTFSLSPAHTVSGGQITYTAPATIPAGSVVTILASSSAPAQTPSNPAIASTRIIAPTPAIAFVQTPPGTLAGGAQAPVSAAITNDVLPGGVAWTLQCNSSVSGECGTIAPYYTASGDSTIYTAPTVTEAGTSVTITATSLANSSIAVTSTPIAITPATDLSVSFVPSLPSHLQVDATVNVTASVTNDTTRAGMDWQVCSSGCGFFTIKPAVPAIPATPTTPYVPASSAVTATSVSGWPNGLAIPYTAPSQPPSSGYVAVTALAHADVTKANSGTITIGASSTGAAVNGVVQAGTLPVAGSAVTLYAAGTSGYASLATPLASSPVTDSGGRFTVPAGYTCPQPGSQVYLVAKGGHAGTNGVNPNLALMAALGSCDALGSTPIVVNEVTTIASTVASANFASNDALNGNSSYLYFGASGSNAVGLANAFAAANNLVDLSTGQARSITPAGNASVPYAEINTLADALAACTASSGGQEGDTTSCGLLFTATDLLGTGTFGASIAPSDTLQAAFNLAQHPVTNYGYNLDSQRNFFTLATPASPFQPILSTAPSDWSISLHYTSGGGLTRDSAVGSFAIDAGGNVWITDSKAGSVIEWNTVGAALSPSSGFPAGGGLIGIDATGNVWISGDGVLTELTSLGAQVPGSPFSGVLGGGADLAIDATGDAWITDAAGVHEFSNVGAQLSPLTGYTNSNLLNLSPVVVDNANHVWIGTNTNSINSGDLAELTNPGGQVITVSPVGQIQPQIAADGAGDLWGVTLSCLYKIPPYGGKGTILVPSCTSTGGSNSVFNGVNVANPRGIAIDGAGTVWVAGPGGTVLATVPPGLLPVQPSSTITNSSPYVSSTLAVGTLRVAVDGSGNVWVLLADNSVTEYIGAATPVVAPLALGVKNGKLAARP